ncbi:3-oxo-5-alpha-steroid 4-dehydrogenase 2a isoform X2 [Pimephales promelas]|uniref:3-oxo-5-alpha-steroid 4-dehydrogenase 2a isoform X2 n=1 Tax=Pimephales promelas TaxID=90988 RepID=UPI001955EECD|nr:3-oxo-5-alpha-steroid 4-dehydrogenase 2a isoform X2 [Pimephales promelas]KAG1956148.1 3-oxo-5-alpha-steroid 4-dehydrogenase [Pimephales promelas]
MTGEAMICQENAIHYCSWGFVVSGLLYLLRQLTAHTPYGRYVDTKSPGVMVPARAGWFIQELPSFLVPVLLFLTTESLPGIGRHLLLWTFCLHYFQRTFVFSLLTKGRPSPLYIVLSAVIFCSVNGFLQGHYMLHCTQYHTEWHRDTRFITGVLMFFSGMAINIHSDYILRNLRKPGELSYKIPTGGMFELVSGANFFGEIIEWCGYAVASWSFPAFSFALFTICSIGPRAYHHHRYYLEKFKDYPKSRKAVIPFLL